MCLPCRAGKLKDRMDGIVQMFPEKQRIEPGTSPIRNKPEQVGISNSEHLQEVKKDRQLSMLVSDMLVASERSCQRNKENDSRSQIPRVRTIAWFSFI